MIATFGGASEPGETPIACALREIAEETLLQLKPSQLEFLITLPFPVRPGKNIPAHYFAARGIDTTGLDIREGKLYRIARGATPPWRGMTDHCVRAVQLFLEG